MYCIKWKNMKCRLISRASNWEYVSTLVGISEHIVLLKVCVCRVLSYLPHYNEFVQLKQQQQQKKKRRLWLNN